MQLQKVTEVKSDIKDDSTITKNIDKFQFKDDDEEEEEEYSFSTEVNFFIKFRRSVFFSNLSIITKFMKSIYVACTL